MSTTFEAVLSQAEKLSRRERTRLINILSKPSLPDPDKRTKARPTPPVAKNGNSDEAVFSALRAWVDEIVRTENYKPNSSAKIAERIRKWNDRGYKL